MPPGEWTKTLIIAAMSPKLIHNLLDPNDIPTTSREMPGKRPDCRIIIRRETFRSLDYMKGQAHKGTAFPKGKRLQTFRNTYRLLSLMTASGPQYQSLKASLSHCPEPT